MLGKQDQPVDDAEWHCFLRTHDFGHLIAPGDGTGLPVVVPTHYRYDNRAECVELHLHRLNPVWKAIEARPVALLSVTGAAAYIPSYWNVNPEESGESAVPTSLYASVQLGGPAMIVDEANGLAALLERQLAQHQPEGRHGTFAPGSEYSRLLRGVRGLHISAETVRTKFRFGGNRGPAVRAAIARHLRVRGSEADVEAAEHLERRT